MQDVIELATPDVALHLLVPFVVVPTVQPRRQLGALFERKLFDGSLDFRKAHVGDLTIAQLLFQVPVIQSEIVSIGSSGLALISRTVSKGSSLVQFGFKIDRALVVKTGVESGAVVEGFDVIEDGGAGLGAGSEAMMVDQFVFESAKEGLDEGVIVAVAFATHGSDQAMLGQELVGKRRWRTEPRDRSGG